MTRWPGLSQFELTDNVAIVTGGSKGLGEAMAAGLASAGSHVLLVSRNEAEAQSAASVIAEEYPVKAIGIAADVTSEDEVKRMVQHAQSEFGRIDTLINSAGINIRGPIEELSLDEFRQVQQVNVDAMWLCAKHVIPVMKQRNYGRIINMASTLGLVGLANRTPYATSKGAVVNLTRSARFRTRSRQDHGQRYLSRTIPDAHERADRRNGRGQKIHRWRDGIAEVGRPERDTGSRNIPRQSRVELCHRQHANC